MSLVIATLALVSTGQVPSAVVCETGHFQHSCLHTASLNTPLKVMGQGRPTCGLSALVLCSLCPSLRMRGPGCPQLPVVEGQALTASTEA